MQRQPHDSNHPHEHLFPDPVYYPIKKWISVEYLRVIRPDEIIKDERIPVVLRQLRQPTFVTIDTGFWHRRWRDARYCIVCFPLTHAEQPQISDRLRRLLRLPPFRTRAARMGKVIRVREEESSFGN